MNGIFYSPNVLQLPIKPALTSFTGKDNMKNNEYSAYLDKVKAKINDKTIPEFGNFAQVSVNTVLKNNNSLVFQVKPLKKSDIKKELSINFANAKTQKMALNTRVFQNKDELLKYINSIDEKGLESIIKNFETDTGDK